MKQSRITRLHAQFEEFAHKEDGTEYWLARELQGLRGYSKWDNFVQVVEKAKLACTTAGHEVEDHFADVGKMVGLRSEAQCIVDAARRTR